MQRGARNFNTERLVRITLSRILSKKIRLIEVLQLEQGITVSEFRWR